MDKYLWKFHWDSDCAFLGGLFVATEEEVKNLIGKTLDLGEYEGKYSEVVGTLEEGDISLVSKNPIVVKEIGNFGINPLNFIEKEDNEEAYACGDFENYEYEDE